MHPDFLPAVLTWDQISQWQAYYNAEPWGEARADQRTQAQTMWLKAGISFETHNLPDLAFPYFARAEDWIEQKATLDRLADKARAKLEGRNESE